MKGPNSVFAGLSNAGGTVNVIRMKPAFRAAGSLEVSGGDHENRRITFRQTGPLLADRLAYLLVYGHTSKRAPSTTSSSTRATTPEVSVSGR